MPHDDPLAYAIHDTIMDICEVMHRRGFESASVGAIMRLLGVPESKAREHDDQVFYLDQEFETMLAQRRIMTSVPRDAVIH